MSDLKPAPVNPRTIIWTTSAANLTVMGCTTQSVLKRKGLKKTLPLRLLKDTQIPATVHVSANSHETNATKNRDRRDAMHERLKHDVKEVTSIITNNESSFSPLSIRDHLRLGKYRENSKRPCPVLVTAI